MAESQDQYHYHNSAQLKLNLSQERFYPYLVKAGFKETYAFNLYLYNARLAKSFLYPLHILEVALRNRIDSIFTEMHGANWPRDAAYRQCLTAESLDALNKGIQRAKSLNTKDIVSTLTFDFWSNLFRPEYDRPFWQSNMQKLLPNVVKTRHEFQQDVKKLNQFRNRIAHHEPIHNFDILLCHKEILDCIKGVCADTYDWTKHYSTVTSVLRTSPSATGETKPHFGERCDSLFLKVDETTHLSEIDNYPFYYYEADEPLVLEKRHLMDFMFLNTDHDDGTIMMDLKTVTFRDIVDTLKIRPNIQRCGSSESLTKAKQIFKGRDISYIVVEDKEKIVGIIAKAHRHY